MNTILTIPATELEHPTEPIAARLAGALVIRVAGWLDDATCRQYVAGVYAGRERWTSDFDGEQFTLGRAWYTHLEQGKSRAYFENAAAANADMERFVPGLQQRLVDIAQLVLGAKVVPRPRWCGPGVHIFPAGGEVAGKGGVVHFDLEGLTPVQVAQRAPTLTLIVMLQPAEAGGGLRVWDRAYEQGEECVPGPEVATDLLAYETGDLVLMDSYRLHQIQPFSGSKDRISATAHLALAGNLWEIWF